MVYGGEGSDCGGGQLNGGGVVEIAVGGVTLRIGPAVPAARVKGEGDFAGGSFGRFGP